MSYYVVPATYGSYAYAPSGYSYDAWVANNAAALNCYRAAYLSRPAQVSLSLPPAYSVQAVAPSPTSSPSSSPPSVSYLRSTAAAAPSFSAPVPQAQPLPSSAGVDSSTLVDSFVPRNVIEYFHSEAGKAHLKVQRIRFYSRDPERGLATFSAEAIDHNGGSLFLYTSLQIGN